MESKITIKGARQHNLKNINLEIPKNKLVVITGLSGSGKSTLAFDTIFAEGQRRYVESLSAYARQFLQIMDKPDVDSIEGLSPAISIQQKTTNKNPRSTVGTITEIYDYLRLLYSKIGVPYCPNCNREISYQSLDAIVGSILNIIKNKDKGIVYVLSPIIRERKGTYEKILRDLKEEGYTRIRIDKQIVDISEMEEFNIISSQEKHIRHSIEIVIDRIVTEKSSIEKDRLSESVQAAIGKSGGVVEILFEGEEFLFSQKNSCPICNISIGEMEPRSFSFNSPFGACPHCHGLGVETEFDPDLIIPDKTLSILEGAIKPWSSGQFSSFRTSMLKDVGKRFGFNLNTPINKMTKNQLDVILYGTDLRIRYNYTSKSSDSSWEYSGKFEGVISNLQRIYNDTESESKREEIRRYMIEKPCESCKGQRLKKEILAVKINGHSIIDVCNLSVDRIINFFSNLDLDHATSIISRQVLKEINSRLKFLSNVGLDYLSLNRNAGTLSGGESQRIRLATQIGTNLTGVLYVLDEPTIGLHQRDNKLLINTLLKLRDIGNTVIVVEHDEEIIRSADWIIDIGPEAGVHGGQVVAEGELDKVLLNPNSITAEYLSGKKIVNENYERKPIGKKFLKIKGARENNLKNINPSFPLGVITAVTGVSGSGKSTLVNDILFNYLNNHFYKSKYKVGMHDGISGLEFVDKVIGIDQSPIGRTPRSNAITYVNAFTHIRDLFAKTQTARERGYKMGRFSFNLQGGRCDMCDGAGVRKIEMQFLPDVYITCDQCKGNRYNHDTLEVRYKGKNIADILNMTVEEALEFFKNNVPIKNKLKLLEDVGLGYLHLGQSATTLSGGEAQRIKLATELSKKDSGNTVYILDEPTTGLHFADVKKLLKILIRLRDLGNTIIIIEHNLDIISSADWIIDLGPEGGDKGGYIIATGTPEEVSENPKSQTGKFLKDKLSSIRKNEIILKNE
ncbi:excinuclease ABC subunit UvrA [Candidatus Nitrosocosmicus franklandus]|uniref:UvrABC system protein A n=1 Tax=Candidatus Nitrosocosmicus franklandianus TaxID=1798806 RepID=A0A484ID59_9ARCH|nr:excinuclease ABC subunit UvrA [Candidatus Nitrosocosmicus franklandus]VFJ15030.1 ATPase and DNA damage recognition protein of nucleotide excision repair excinuclease UvrABC [Candidatus Nitrosocosmicus franklandus]